MPEVLEITIPVTERWNDALQKFEELTKEYVLHLKHTLVSISKWEQEWHEPFLKTEKTYEQTCDYIRCMTLDENVPSEVYEFIPDKEIVRVNEYIADKATATWINEPPDAKREGESRAKSIVITNELVYCWMIESNIPVEFENWHFNRLMTLIKVVQRRQQESDPNRKKMSKAELANYHRETLKANRARLRKGKT